ncbi:M15 family metallopeptidase [Clostridium manihotivorum]|uniref:D-alanyl-D-alanine carboxypeptidase n=1 Tax=Clostridium manihotivorum TaxID=2320868 RepID=A0A410DXP1_9CLOT|nr:M15 family metallopeptidase [Clostridium manihotivorum]QAA33874.1 D-alanyl-D-alanine carboxypeptidase [Clostridium manihotivorum]
MAKKKANKSSILKRLFFLYSFILMMSIVVSASIITVNKSKDTVGIVKKSENLASNNSEKTISIDNEKPDATAEKNEAKLTKEKVDNIAQKDYRLLLVNKNYPLDSTFKPNELVTPNVKRIGSVSLENRKMSREAAKALENMFFDAKKDKINLILVSAYRSYESQADVYERKVETDGATEASKYVAKEGSSEHQTGLAVDVNSSPYYDLAEDFEKTKEGKWIAENANKYGFVIRYLKGKSDITGYNYEPWHLRYVGTDAAKYMFDNNLCLEEYVQKLASEQK